MLLVDHDQVEPGVVHDSLEQCMGAHDDTGLAAAMASSAARRPAPLSEPVSSVTGMAASTEQVADGLSQLPSEQVGRAPAGRPVPRPSGERQRVGGHRGLAGPDIALDQAQHRHRPATSARMASIAASLVGVRTTSRPTRRLRARRRSLCRRLQVSDVSDADDRTRLVVALTATRDHAQLERQQLVVGQASDGRVALLEIVRVVGRLDGDADRGPPSPISAARYSRRAR